MYIKRVYDKIEKHINQNKVLLIYGPRRVGKTTILRNYLDRLNVTYRLESGDNIRLHEILGTQNFDKIIEYCRGYKIIAIDEAHKIPNIGMGLKIIVDNIPGISVIATGSSSFELAGQVGEPLVGRKKTIMMYPISIMELQYEHNAIDIDMQLSNFLVYGMYPDVLTTSNKNTKREILDELVNAYLFKDILDLERVKGSKILLDLLRLIAFQVGSEVSMQEIGMKLSLDSKTVARYLDLFEKAFIIFNLRGYSKNLREEITKKSKYYFFDNGILNAIISNFNELEIRNDIGLLWENFLVSERIKKMAYTPIYSNVYFWRTWSQKEIDWVEEREGKLFGYEFKYSDIYSKHAKEFQLIYPNSTVEVINKNNYKSFVGI